MSPTPDSPTPVGEQLKARREKLDLTQGSLASLVGVTVTSISAAENSRSAISRSKRPLWERALQLKPGTISAAYNDGTPLEAAQTLTDLPYADMSDAKERAVWEMELPVADRIEIIDAVRARAAQQRRGHG
ncbi:helix-turn-helix domain-containing protein [Streptomyces corynorhini]|uniref:XRE family transcriptional regulator n=1 Tax=Streptomyces corynorhini TaxID=2282652 RepID=A0A370B3N4_9ACTN|nr:helix-turn-helix transcriptional regulator [Streptomyces corynorhini]RDG34674.1 XRE family transcriptional regulator [Streptomyces corynorhini]